MKLIWEQADLEQPEVVIRGRLEDKKTTNLIQTLQGLLEAERNVGKRIFLHKDGREFLWETADIQYFATENGRIFAMGKEKGRLETKFKLYELAEMLGKQGFIQINKGTLVNIRFVAAVEAGFSGNYVAFLKDGKTKLEISRSYMKTFRKYVMEGKDYD